MSEALSGTTSSDELRGAIDEARSGLYARLRRRPPGMPAVRPESGAWSVVENVRHLLFAEEKHLGRLFLEDFSYSAIGLRTDGRRRATGAGSQPTDDVEEVLIAWDAVHEAVWDAVQQAADPTQALSRNLRHLRSHIRTIEALLDEQSASGG